MVQERGAGRHDLVRDLRRFAAVLRDVVEVRADLRADLIDERGGEGLGLALVGVAGIRDLAIGRRGAAALLRDVRDLVGDQRLPGGAGRIVGPGGEVQIVAERERPGPDRGGGGGGARVGVHAHRAERQAQLGLEATAQLVGQRLAATAGVDVLEGGGERAVLVVDVGVLEAIDAARARLPRREGVVGTDGVALAGLALRRARGRGLVFVLARVVGATRRGAQELARHLPHFTGWVSPSFPSPRRHDLGAQCPR